MYVPIFRCDGESSFCIVKFGEKLGTKQGHMDILQLELGIIMQKDIVVARRREICKAYHRLWLLHQDKRLMFVSRTQKDQMHVTHTPQHHTKHCMHPWWIQSSKAGLMHAWCEAS
jgi:hypothetical protein